MSHSGVIFRRSNATESSVMRTWGRMLAMVLVFEVFWPPDAWSADHWVGPKGRDGDNLGTRGRPWATLQYAADRVRPGDTVHVLDGDYSGFDLRRGGSQQASVGFKAEGKRVRIVRRNQKTPDGINVEQAGFVVIDGFTVNAMPRAGVRGAGSPHLTVQKVRADHNGVWGIFTAFCDDLKLFENETSNSVKEHGIYVSNSGDRPIVRGNTSWGNRGCGIHMNGDAAMGGDGIISGALIENNIIYGNCRGGGSGINCAAVQDSTFRNNLLCDNYASGISLYRGEGGGGSRNNRIVNNTIAMPSDARWAINIKNQSTNNLVWNNILLNANRSAGSVSLDADSVAGFQSDYNILTDRMSRDDDASVLSLKGWVKATGLDRHSVTGQPELIFANAKENNFQLRTGSPAIDAADPAVAPKTDAVGQPRTAGSGPDIGAFEFMADMDSGRAASANVRPR